jgi:replication factor C small subunit
MIAGSEQMLWVERFRPRKVNDCIIPDVLKETLQAYVERKEIPNMILHGGPGVGKTTVARAMCDEIGCDYILLNGSDKFGIDDLHIKVKGYASSMALSGGRKVIIIDEADYMSAQAQAGFRGVIEEFIDNCSFIFTCNQVNKLIAPLHSRCAVIDFKLQSKDKQAMALAFYKRVTEILTQEGVEFDKKVVAELLQKFFPDYRRVLNELQRYSVRGKIDTGILAQVSDVKLDELIGYLKAKDFKGVRKWVGLNADSDSTLIMRQLYDKMSEIFTPDTLPILVVLTGKYLYQAAFALDAEINLAAYLTEVLVECQVK